MTREPSITLGLRLRQDGSLESYKVDTSLRPLEKISYGYFSLPGKKAIYFKLARPLRSENGNRYLAINRYGKVVKRFRDTKAARATIVRPRPEAHWPKHAKLARRY